MWCCLTCCGFFGLVQINFEEPGYSEGRRENIAERGKRINCRRIWESCLDIAEKGRPTEIDCMKNSSLNSEPQFFIQKKKNKRITEKTFGHLILKEFGGLHFESSYSKQYNEREPFSFFEVKKATGTDRNQFSIRLSGRRVWYKREVSCNSSPNLLRLMTIK